LKDNSKDLCGENPQTVQFFTMFVYKLPKDSIIN